MKYVYALAIVCTLAIGPAFSDEVNEVRPTPDQVGQQSLYDLGVKPQQVVDPDAEETKPLVVEAPEGKADKIVVLGAPWCRWCTVYEATLATLKAEGYKVEKYDIEDAEDLKTLGEKYSNIKQSRSPTTVNEWSSLPTTFYIRGNQIIKREGGFLTPVKVKETLWKPGDLDETPVVDKVNEVRRKLPWNK